ncbi:MAG TPA: hypothetical protein VE934_10835 [Polaromonas sp.]|uniref:hypothetical protein n=1 Tax=Polaromonas sp. TaxID=1869339 RepID=UPI002D299A73|nr:hypothetical protein [Polaromonas sp.]HYW57449.1 hypothetical protein [Polaromonas sp.]
MTAESVPEIKPAASQTGNQQSTVDFPYIDLDAAVETAQGVHSAGGMACEAEQLAAQLNMESKGGGFRQRINGARIYGLITYERGGRITLTELGRRVIDGEKERAARIDAFLAVELYGKVYEQFRGSPLPPQAALERSLVTLGVGDGVKDKARQVLMRSAKQAGFFDMAADRLTKPAIRVDAVGKTDEKPAQEDPKKNGGGGGGGGDHPLIQGLMLTLPKSGEDWEYEERFNWLNMANSIFKMVYKASISDSDVEVKLMKRP